MKTLWSKALKAAPPLVTLALGAMPAQAWQTAQVLERVEVFNKTSVLDMAFDEVGRSRDFSVLVNTAQASYSACTLTAASGRWCLDGKTVVNWPDATKESEVFEVIKCEDPALGLDTRKADTCTGFTIDSKGAIYLAGKNKGKTHSLIKIVKKIDGLCPTDGFFTPLALSTDYCAVELATGRPLLVDINTVDTDAAERFNADCNGCAARGKGTLGLEERKTAVFFPDEGAPVTIASGKRDWNLAGNEQLSSIALLQLPNAQGGFDSHVLVTTDNGRVLAAETDGSPDVREVFDLNAGRRNSSRLCTDGTQVSSLRASQKSGIVFVTDRKYCEVIALEPVVNSAGELLKLANLQENGQDFTLSTADDQGIFPPLGPTIAAGRAIDLAECGEFCVLVGDEAGNPAAILSNVKLAGSESRALNSG